MKQFVSLRIINGVVIAAICIVFLVSIAFVTTKSSFAESALVTKSVIFVDTEATGAATGADWANAYPTLQVALQTANTDDELWIADGIYYPDIGAGISDDDPDATFVIPDGVSLFGGFGGGESNRSDADWLTNLTVLSGDIDQNDGVNASGVVTETGNVNGNNSTAPVVTVVATVQLQGLYITAGKGGGLRMDNAELSLTNVAFWGNGMASSTWVHMNALNVRRPQ